MRFVENVFPPLARFVGNDKRVALVTLVNIDGTSPRPVGSQSGVSETGESVGMITGGCAEKAIEAEALQCLRKGENKLIRYGEGSPYLDVVLPCGSGIDLYFETKNAKFIVETAAKLHAVRQSAFMYIDLDDLTSGVSEKLPQITASQHFEHEYEPDYRILVFGEGANLIALCSIADQSGYYVTALSPDADALAFLEGSKITRRRIHREADFSAIDYDRYTAVVTLFHEHAWETPILHAALNSDAHYIGALGSRRTHEMRLKALSALPKTRRNLSDIHGPVGLDIGATNPNEIAVSVLAEIVKQRHACGT